MDLVQEKSFVVYLLGPSPEGKFYVGQSEDVARRMVSHRRADGGCPELHRAIRRFGWEAFPARLLAQTDQPDEADRLERFHIARHNALFPHGYNMTTGGRSTLFAPGARVEGFEEAGVGEAEMRAAAGAMAGPRGRRRAGTECPLCGAPSDWTWGGGDCSCDAQADMALVALRHLAAGGTAESLGPIEDRMALERWRKSGAGDLFIEGEKRRLRAARRAAGDRARVKLADVLPIAACRYVQRLLPYAAGWARRAALVGRGLPSRCPGRFIAVPGGAARARLAWAIEDSLARGREDLDDPARRARLFARQFARCARHRERDWPVAEAALREIGAPEEEIGAARRRGAFLSRVEREMRASGIGASEGEEGVPGLEPEIVVLAEAGPLKGKVCAAVFPDGAAWTGFLESLLEMPPASRNAAAAALVQSPPEGVRASAEDPGPPLFESGTDGDSVWFRIGWPEPDGKGDQGEGP